MFKKLMSEAVCLKIITIACAVIAFFSVVAGIMTHSTALLFNASLAIIDVIISAVTLWIIKKLKISERNIEYPFGYFKYEPLLVVAQIIMLLTACLISGLHAFTNLYHHSAFIRNYGVGFVFLIFTSIINLIIYIYTKIVCKKQNSALLASQAVDWFVDCMLSTGLLIGFFVSYYLEFSSDVSLQPYAAYVDPVMTFCVIIAVIKQPSSLLLDNIYDLLDKTPTNTPLAKDLKKMTQKCARALDVKCLITTVKIRRAGRAYFAELIYHTDGSSTLANISKLNHAAWVAAHKKYDTLYLHLLPRLIHKKKSTKTD